MAYLIGQYNKNEVSNDDKNFMQLTGGGGAVRQELRSDKGVTEVWRSSSNDDTGITRFFTNESYQCGVNQFFKGKESYYVHCRIKRLRSNQNFYIKLYRSDKFNNATIDYREQYVKTISIAADTTLNHTSWVDVEFIFTPLIDCDIIYFEMVRTAEDLKDSDKGSRIMWHPRFASIIFLEISYIKNMLGYNDYSQDINNPTFIDGIIKDTQDNNTRIPAPFLKMGLQSRPGSTFCINRSEIHIGRTGLYELKNGLITIDYIAPVVGLPVDSGLLQNESDRDWFYDEKIRQIELILAQYDYPEEFSDEEVDEAYSQLMGEATLEDENKVYQRGPFSTSFSLIEELIKRENGVTEVDQELIKNKDIQLEVYRKIPAFSIDYTYEKKI